MPLTERLEIRLSPAEKDVIERAAKRADMSVSDYVRMCCHKDVMAEEDPAAIKRLFQVQAQQLIEILASGRAATFQRDEDEKRMTAIVARGRRRRG